LLDGLGSYRRQVTTTSEGTQRYFDQGLNLLFAFNHDAAARSFRQAATLDPSCAMAWWGVAIAQGPHINRPVVDANQAVVAYEALRKARAEGVRASRLERAVIDALAARCVSAPPRTATHSTGRMPTRCWTSGRSIPRMPISGP
jgi:hypothetical protein